MSNRKKHATGGTGVEMARVIVGGVVLLVGAMGYLALNSKCDALGNQIKKARAEQAALDRELRNEEHNWAQAKSVRNMERLLSENGIEMTWPEERNIVRVKLRKAGEAVTLARAD